MAQAAEALTSPDAPCAGRPYFITNDDPQPFWGFLGDLLQPLGYARPSTRLPWRLIFVLALIFELVVRLLKPFMVLQCPAQPLSPKWQAMQQMLPAPRPAWSCTPCMRCEMHAWMTWWPSCAPGGARRWRMHAGSPLFNRLSFNVQSSRQEVRASEFTPMRIRIAKATRQLSCAAARRDLGYAPQVPIQEGVARTVKHFSYLHASGDGGVKKGA